MHIIEQPYPGSKWEKDHVLAESNQHGGENDRATKQFTFYKEEQKNDNFSRSMNCEPNTNESIPTPACEQIGG